MEDTNNGTSGVSITAVVTIVRADGVTCTSNDPESKELIELPVTAEKDED